MASTVGAVNPIRYRSYYYDTDTGFYYLQTRYYDPAIRRFINADDISNLAANGDFASLNLYAYCGNNPVARSDDGGEFWNLIIGAAVGAVVGGFASAMTQLLDPSTNAKEAIKTGNFWKRVAVGAASGAVTGLVAATGVGLAGQVAWNAGTAAVSSVVDTAIATEGKASFATYAINAVESAAFGAVAGFLGGKGSGTNHLSSAWDRVWHNYNFSYYFTQINVESVKSGLQAIPAILKGIIPSMTKATIKKMNSLG